MPDRRDEALRHFGAEVLGFRLEEYLDSGWTADVYRGRRGDELAAVKLYPSRDLLEPRAWSRAQREREAMRAVNHPNVCRLIDAGDAMIDGQQRPAVVMELIEGQSLAEHVRATRAMTWPELRAFGIPLLDAVAALHNAGLRHRDIKPENVRIERGTNRLVLVDLGLVIDVDAAEADPLTMPHEFLGPVRYAPLEYIYRDPPEAINNAAVDVYGVGATFYFMLTGREPYDELTNKHAIAKAKLEVPLRMPEERLPPRIRPPLRGMVSARPELRPSIGLVREAMGSISDDEAAAIPRTSGAPADRLRQYILGTESVRLSLETQQQQLADEAAAAELRNDVCRVARDRIERSDLASLPGFHISTGGVELSRFTNAEQIQQAFPDMPFTAPSRSGGVNGYMVYLNPLASRIGLIGASYSLFAVSRAGVIKCVRLVGTDTGYYAYADISSGLWVAGTSDDVWQALTADVENAVAIMGQLAADANERRDPTL